MDEAMATQRDGDGMKGNRDFGGAGFGNKDPELGRV